MHEYICTYISQYHLSLFSSVHCRPLSISLLSFLSPTEGDVRMLLTLASGCLDLSAYKYLRVFATTSVGARYPHVRNPFTRLDGTYNLSFCTQSLSSFSCLLFSIYFTTSYFACDHYHSC